MTAYDTLQKQIARLYNLRLKADAGGFVAAVALIDKLMDRKISERDALVYDPDVQFD